MFDRLLWALILVCFWLKMAVDLESLTGRNELTVFLLHRVKKRRWEESRGGKETVYKMQRMCVCVCVCSPQHERLTRLCICEKNLASPHLLNPLIPFWNTCIQLIHQPPISNQIKLRWIQQVLPSPYCEMFTLQALNNNAVQEIELRKHLLNKIK